jgi:parallel beta-helix repeat protein
MEIMKKRNITQRSLNNKPRTVAIASIAIVLMLFGTVATAVETVKTQNICSNALSSSIELTDDYTLTGDMTFEEGHGFIIKSDGITLNGAGHKITGSKSVATCEWISATDPNVETAGHGVLNSGYDNVVIKNLEINNFATGIYLHGIATNNVENNLIENCEIHDNGLINMGGSGSESVTHGIHTCYTKNTQILNNEIYDNEGTGDGCEDGGNGIYMHGGDGLPDLNTISGNDFYGNAKAGLWMKKSSDTCTISNNHAWNNGNGAGIGPTAVRGGLILRCKTTHYNTIEHNTVENNYGDGIFIGGNNNDIDNNDITSNNGNGVNFGRNDGSQNNNLNGNTICSNGEYDVFNIYDNFGGGNTGDDNTGDTASNYRDEGTTGTTYFTYSCGGSNNAPNAPTITGPSSNLEAGKSYNYNFVATDPDGDQIYYCITWGDGSSEVCIGPFDSGNPQTVSHSWSESSKTYKIRATAKDIHDLEGPEGSLTVTTPKAKVYNDMFLRFVKNFPILEQILEKILGIE